MSVSNSQVTINVPLNINILTNFTSIKTGVINTITPVLNLTSCTAPLIVNGYSNLNGNAVLTLFRNIFISLPKLGVTNSCNYNRNNICNATLGLSCSTNNKCLLNNGLACTSGTQCLTNSCRSNNFNSGPGSTGTCQSTCGGGGFNSPCLWL